MEKSLSCSSPSLFISWFIPFSDDHLNASSNIHQKILAPWFPFPSPSRFIFNSNFFPSPIPLPLVSCQFSSINDWLGRLRDPNLSQSLKIPINQKILQNLFFAPSYNFLILPRSSSSNPTSLPPNLFRVFAETYHKTYQINSNHVLPPFLFHTSHSSRHLTEEDICHFLIGIKHNRLWDSDIEQRSTACNVQPLLFTHLSFKDPLSHLIMYSLLQIHSHRSSSKIHQLENLQVVTKEENQYTFDSSLIMRNVTVEDAGKYKVTAR